MNKGKTNNNFSHQDRITSSLIPLVRTPCTTPRCPLPVALSRSVVISSPRNSRVVHVIVVSDHYKTWAPQLCDCYQQTQCCRGKFSGGFSNLSLDSCCYLNQDLGGYGNTLGLVDFGGIGKYI